MEDTSIIEGTVSIDGQKEEDNKTVHLVRKLFAKAKAAKKPYSENWLEYYKFFRGKQWDEKRPSYRHSEVLNFIYSSVQTIIPILTDNRPSIDAIPEDPTDSEFAKIITHILKSKWEGNEWDAVVADGIVDMSIYGTAIGEVPWDADESDGLGDFLFRTVDPFYFYPDPRMEDVNDRKGKYVIIAEPRDVAEVKRLYPDKAKHLKSDMISIDNAKSDKSNINDIVIKSPVDSKTLVQSDSPDPQSEQADQILLICCYMHSDEMTEIEIEEKDKEGKTKKKYQAKKKYPNGRKIVIAGNVLLEDKENPYVDGKFPYAKLIDFILPREFWGIGEVENQKSPQIIINKLISYILDYMTLMGNPIWVVDSSSGIDTENLFNAPGLVIEKNPGTEVRRESGVPLPPYVYNLLQLFIERIFDKLSGIHEVTQGARTFGSDQSGVAIGLLQEAAQTKLRLKSRNVEKWLRQIGRLMVSRILQFYSVPRIIRITNDLGAAQYFKVTIKDSTNESGEVKQMVQYQEYGQDEMGNPVEGPVQEQEIKGNLDIRITTGTSLPLQKAMKEQRADKLLNIGIYDAEDYLSAIDEPNKEKVLKKFTERQQAAAQAQAQQMQQPAQ